MTDLETLYRAIDAQIDANFEAEVGALASLIRIPSKRGEPQKDAPYGESCAQALSAALALGHAMGFETCNLDNRIGYLQTGSGSDLLGVLAHLDVVPEGEGWQKDPYGADIEDGVIWGRGTQDDKGPAVAALFGLYALMRAGVQFDRRVRLILGCDEECGSSDLEYYIDHAESPSMVFSPDAQYPLVNGEKGICRIAIEASLPSEGNLPRVRSIAAGERPNIVVPVARAEVEGLSAAQAQSAAQEIERRDNVTVALTDHDGVLLVEVTGTGSHGAMPWMGNNAATALLELLCILPLKDEVQWNTLCELSHVLPHGDYNGRALGIACSDPLSGDLTCNPGIVTLANGALSVTLDIRYPLDQAAQPLFETLCTSLSVCTARLITDMPPHYVPPEHPLVQKLLEAYTEITGLPGRCIAIGGGTYAREFAHGVSFGCLFEGHEDLMHQPNERLPLDELKLNTRIMARAILKLATAL